MFRLFIDCLLLKRHAYEHVEEYSSYTYYALAVIVTTSLTGAFRLAILEGQPFSIGYVLLSLTFWVVLTRIVFALGTTLMKTSETHATFGQVWRTLGFAQLPALFYLFVLIFPLIGIVVFVWQSYTTVLAIQTALDYPKMLRAVGVYIISAIAALVFVVFVFAALGISV